MSEYTADDFAEAKFAEHPDGRLAVRDSDSPASPWRTDGDGWVADFKMPRLGWKPVSVALTTSLSEIDKTFDNDFCQEYVDGYVDGYRAAGGIVVENSNVDRLEGLLRSAAEITGVRLSARAFAEFLAGNGVTADENTE